MIPKSIEFLFYLVYGYLLPVFFRHDMGNIVPKSIGPEKRSDLKNQELKLFNEVYSGFIKIVLVFLPVINIPKMASMAYRHSSE